MGSTNLSARSYEQHQRFLKQNRLKRQIRCGGEILLIAVWLGAMIYILAVL